MKLSNLTLKLTKPLLTRADSEAIAVVRIIVLQLEVMRQLRKRTPQGRKLPSTLAKVCSRRRSVGSASPHSWRRASRNVAAGVVAFSAFTCLVDAVTGSKSAAPVEGQTPWSASVRVKANLPLAASHVSLRHSHGRRGIGILPEAELIRLCGGLSSPVPGLDFC